MKMVIINIPLTYVRKSRLMYIIWQIILNLMVIMETWNKFYGILF